MQHLQHWNFILILYLETLLLNYNKYNAFQCYLLCSIFVLRICNLKTKFKYAYKYEKVHFIYPWNSYIRNEIFCYCHISFSEIIKYKRQGPE